METRPFDATGAVAREKSFIREVFAWMGGGLAVTGLVSALMISNPGAVVALAKNPILFFGIIIVQLILVWQVSMSLQRYSAQTAGIMFTVYAGLNGVIFSTLFLAYTGSSIAATFFIAAGVFGGTALYGWTTKADLTSVGSIAFMGLIGIIIASIVNFFLRSTVMEWVISYLGVAIFIGLTAYDMQRLRLMNQKGFQDQESMAKMSILGALRLYLDFINLFLFLLRIFGQRR
jgi:FtsH-binding integral membrane protein